MTLARPMAKRGIALRTDNMPAAVRDWRNIGVQKKLF
jgi:hypothetical protein